MRHDNEWLGDKCDQVYADTKHVMPYNIAFVAMEYHEHMSRWSEIKDGLPVSNCWCVIVPKESFCGTDNPVLVHYCKVRNLFSEDGEEFPHTAIVKYKQI